MNWPAIALAGACTGLLTGYVWLIVSAVRLIKGPEDEGRGGVSQICQSCIHCGEQIGQNIRCLHPALNEDPELQEIAPDFAEICEDWEPKERGPE